MLAIYGGIAAYLKGDGYLPTYLFKRRLPPSYLCDIVGGGAYLPTYLGGDGYLPAYLRGNGRLATYVGYLWGDAYLLTCSYLC